MLAASHPIRVYRSLVVVVAVLFSGGCSALFGNDDPLPRNPGDTLPQIEDPGEPGALLHDRGYRQVPTGTRAWQIGYASRSAMGEPISVTGQVIVPDGDPPDDGWPVVSWGHPTTGISDQCTPSVDGPTGVHLVDELTNAGLALVVTDYEGLGSQGGHPYLVGPSAGHTMLDAVRAARQLEDAGIRDTSPVVLSGFSQGGHAALWAAQLAPDHAPELQVLGVQAAAPVSDVAAFARRAMSFDEQFGVLVVIAVGFSHAYEELDLADVLSSSVLEMIDLAETQCIGEAVETFTMPVGDGLVADPLALADWSGRLTENRAGEQPVGVPVHVLQSTDDPIVYESVTGELVGRLCANGDLVHVDRLTDVGHAALVPELAVPWILARFAGEPPPTSCP